MFGKPAKKKTVELDGKQIELQGKPFAISNLFKRKKIPPMPQQPKPAAGTAPFKPQPTPIQPAPFSFKPQTPTPTTPPAQSVQSSQPVPEKKPVQPNKPYVFRFPSGQPKAPTPPKPPPQPKPQAPPSPAPAPRSNLIPPMPSRLSYSKIISSIPLPTFKPVAAQSQGSTPSRIRLYIQGVGSKHPELEAALKKEGMKTTLYDFVKRIMIFSLIFSIVIGVVLAIVFYELLQSPAKAVLLALLMSVTIFIVSFRFFLNFPTAKGQSSAKKVERDILFAARDLIIALRSGMPLFNAITSVSSGYGEASKEFLKIVERVQLGTPLEDAIDQTVSTTRSPSFRKIMLQASVSIRVGADVTAALQSVIDQLSQERLIELRRYGQKLNAIAMFYMLFGIILPSMGIAVLTILTTFIPVFSVDAKLLALVVVGIVFLQVIFLQMIRSSRPVFTM